MLDARIFSNWDLETTSVQHVRLQIAETHRPLPPRYAQRSVGSNTLPMGRGVKLACEAKMDLARTTLFPHRSVYR
jgi:hypothetical protein